MSTPNLDDLLLDITTTIELSNRDRQVAESRYRKLKEYLERPESLLLPYLANDKGHIYPQGSIAMGTTVVSGANEDRFDLDALVEMNIPPEWTPEKPIDLLYEALHDFPDAKNIVRCTRCVQVQFAFMHMDVTVMDPCKGARIERAGDIFHSPDSGAARRVPANPYGFSKWFRETVKQNDMVFAEKLKKRRMTNGMDRLYRSEQGAMDAKQDDLPPMLPPRLVSEQVVAIKLIKRYLSLRYQNRTIKRPPSIYLSKLAAEIDYSDSGLFVQLQALASGIQTQMQTYITTCSVPDERNPSYVQDKLNDRWPNDQKDMEILLADMSYLLSELDAAKRSDFKGIKKIFAELFGEKIILKSVESLLSRAENAVNQEDAIGYEKSTGAVILGEAVGLATKAKVGIAPKHNFHCETLNQNEKTTTIS